MRAGVRLSQVSAAQSCQYDQQRHDRGAHAGVGPVEQVCADERQQANPELDFSDVAEGAAALPKQLQQPQQQSCPQHKIPAGSEQTECCRGCARLSEGPESAKPQSAGLQKFGGLPLYGCECKLVVEVVQRLFIGRVDSRLHGCGECLLLPLVECRAIPREFVCSAYDVSIEVGIVSQSECVAPVCRGWHESVELDGIAQQPRRHAGSQPDGQHYWCVQWHGTGYRTAARVHCECELAEADTCAGQQHCGTCEGSSGQQQACSELYAGLASVCSGMGDSGAGQCQKCGARYFRHRLDGVSEEQRVDGGGKCTKECRAM